MNELRLPTCGHCKYCKAMPAKHFIDYEKKTIFGMVPSGKWIETFDHFCYALPEPICIEKRVNIPCYMFMDDTL